jgi:hypothetical protein
VRQVTRQQIAVLFLAAASESDENTDMRNLSTPLITILTSLAALGACKGGGGPIPLDDLEDAVVETLCQRSVDCGEYPDLATCVAVSGFNSNLPEIQAAVDAGRVVYNDGLAGDCLDAFGSIGCTLTEQLSQDLEDLLAVCDEVFEGTVADGATCYINEECVSRDCDVPSCMETCCAGTCVPAVADPPALAIGSDCANDPGNCVDGAYCHYDVMTQAQTCTAQVAAGGACDQFDSCASGLVCTQDGQTATCKAAPGTGDPCTVDSFGCDDPRNFCDPTSLTCLARKAEGAACNSEADECVDWATCTGGTCVRNPDSVGDACDQQNDNCLGDLDCGANSTCEAPVPDPICP